MLRNTWNSLEIKTIATIFLWICERIRHFVLNQENGISRVEVDGLQAVHSKRFADAQVYMSIDKFIIVNSPTFIYVSGIFNWRAEVW